MQLSGLAPHQSPWDLLHCPNMAISPVRPKINTVREPEMERGWGGWKREKMI